MDVKLNKETAEKIKTILSENEKSALRFDIIAFGWGGPVFDIVLDEQKDSDEVVEIEGVKFVAEKDIKPFIRDIEITVTGGRPTIITHDCCC